MAPSQKKTPASGSTSAKGTPPTQRRVSRSERDLQKTRMLYTGVAIAVGLIALLLAGSAIYDYYLKPNKVLASVNGHDITREDYWKYRSFTLFNQVNQYSQYAQYTTGQQQQQYIALAQQSQAELEDTWGSTDVDDQTLNQMIDDQVYIQGLPDLGLSVDDQAVDAYITTQFQASDAPVYTPSPTPTLIPTRAAWATETAVAYETQQVLALTPSPSIPAEGSPTTAGSPAAAGSPLAVESPGSPAAVASPASSPAAVEASPTATVSQTAPATIEAPAVNPQASPATGGSPEVAASASPMFTATPTANPEQAQQTATANYDSYKANVLSQTHMSESDYRRLIALPALARQEVQSHFAEEIGQTADQVEASHILVDTRELADQIYADLQLPGADFAAIAAEKSTDTGSAANGGSLGWFPHGVMVPEFEDVAFAMEPGQVSAPVQSQFGWHIIYLTGKEANRPLNDQQLQQVQTAEVNAWLADEREKMSIESPVEPTPTTELAPYAPPAGTPLVLEGSPVAVPVDATPEP